ncbi:efflux RND transporter periplasmic adaptor subunit [Aliagarivorans marinus]|uniref:efflux RND transporter periplasmic adaptor subunit n=1 Tax=Aliagarivorans marinus TaxID=561965 RepID=UPI00041E59C6|nr:efflux RND transporter periplasmic adaptor subunit [Aliagarivorans marinus]
MFSRFRQFVAVRPYLFSILIVLAVCLWMASGMTPDGSNNVVAAEQDGSLNAPPPTRVQVSQFQTETIEDQLLLYGHTEARRVSVISAEVSGRLIEYLVDPGREVKKGQPLARLDVQDRRSQLARAQALLAQREIEYEGVKALNKQGFQGKASLAQARAALVEAQSSVENLQLAITNTQVLAPYDSVFDERMVEEGAFLGIGDPILKLAETRRLIVRTDVAERDIQKLRLGMPAQVTLLNGEAVEGEVDFIAAVSNPNTLTFRVEVLVENPDAVLKAGLSAEVRIPLGELQALKVTPAVLALDEDGTLGVKTVVDERVAFVPAQLLRSESDGAWLGGFDGEVTIITLGQGFVRHGDPVDAVPYQGAAAAEELSQ